MKHLFVILLLFVPFLVHAARWKIIAETTSYNEKIKILGKEGAKHVLAVIGREKIKLTSKDGSLFSEKSPHTTEFEFKNTDATYRYIHPSYVEANSPKIDVQYDGRKKNRCYMKLH
jgi:hypothetical protein